MVDETQADKRTRAAAAMIDCILAAYAWRETGTYDADSDESRRQAIDRISRQYFERLAALEADYAAALQRIVKNGQSSVSGGLPNDMLAHEKNWCRLGMTHRQLILTGSLRGGAAGICVDALTFMATMGIGLVTGGIIGAGFAWLRGHALPRPTLAEEHKVDKHIWQLKLGPSRHPNFGWVLLDYLLMQYRNLHGHKADTGVMAELPKVRRSFLARWFRDCRKQRGQDDDGSVQITIEAMLARIEQP